MPRKESNPNPSPQPDPIDEVIKEEVVVPVEKEPVKVPKAPDITAVQRPAPRGMLGENAVEPTVVQSEVTAKNGEKVQIKITYN